MDTPLSSNVAFARRIGPDPHANGQKTAACNNCPDLWELDNGDIAIIGIRITSSLSDLAPASKTWKFRISRSFQPENLVFITKLSWPSAVSCATVRDGRPIPEH